MKVRITRLIMVAAIAALVVMGAVTPVLAQSPNFPNFGSVANLTLNGNAARSGTALQLTPAAPYQDGSAWFNIAQPVAGAFSTTFTFQLSGSTNTGFGPADGIAFVIQNSALTALGPNGCGIGFGGSAYCTPGSGIPNSLAVEFNTFNNGTGVDPSNSDVTIQNCSGTSANSVDSTCSIKLNDLTKLAPPITLADGNVHTVTINYSGPTTTLLDVILDGIDLFPKTVANPSGGVLFNMATIGLASGNAWVGFTAVGTTTRTS